MYILATGSAVCSYADAFAADADCGIANRRPSPQTLAAGDIFGAAHFLLDRAPELPCLCPLLLRWHPLAQAVEAVGTCTLVQLCMYITCRHAYTHTHTYASIYLDMYVCMCACVCVCA